MQVADSFPMNADVVHKPETDIRQIFRDNFLNPAEHLAPLSLVRLDARFIEKRIDFRIAVVAAIGAVPRCRRKRIGTPANGYPREAQTASDWKLFIGEHYRQ